MTKVAIILVLVILGLALLWVFGPREPMDGARSFDPDRFGDDIEDIEAWLAASEAAVPGIRPGTEKRIVRAAPGAGRTPLSVVYVHGFSATSEEIRPVPDLVARVLGANLFYTRLAGHGLDGEALAAATVAQWRDDMDEALEIGRRIGERVIVIGTSTGATLTALALARPEARRQVAGVVMVSPNFGINEKRAWLLDWPFARWFVPLFVGEERLSSPGTGAHARWWTVRYPSTAVLPVAAAVRAARGVDYAAIDVPALFVFSDRDQVVRPEITREVAARWGGPVDIFNPEPGPGDDSSAHVIAGWIFSPGLTAPVADRVIGWARALR